MPGITDEIINAQKKLQTGIAEAKQEHLKCQKAAADAARIREGRSKDLLYAIKALIEADKAVEQGLADVASLIKDAEQLAEKYDMLRRQAKEAEDHLAEMKETAAKAEKAAKANKADKKLQMAAELAEKAQDKAERQLEMLTTQVKSVEDFCRKPLEEFEQFQKADWEAGLRKMTEAIEQMHRATTSAAEHARLMELTGNRGTRFV